MGFNLGAICLILALLGLALAYGIDGLERYAQKAEIRPSGGTLARTLGGRNLTIPAAWFRATEQPVTGFAKQVDLQLTLPLGPEAAPRAIEVTLLPRSRVRPSSSLLDGVYLHQFESQQFSGPPGLIGKPLAAQEGYANETVWYDALSANPFVAKCMSAVSADVPARCLRSVYLGPGLAATYAFDQDVLENWRQFDPALETLLAEIGAE
jgi:hypothetical protein